MTLLQTHGYASLCWGAGRGCLLDAISGIIPVTDPRTEPVSGRDRSADSGLHALLLKSSQVLLRKACCSRYWAGYHHGSAAWLVTRLTGQLAIRLFIPPVTPPCAA